MKPIFLLPAWLSAVFALSVHAQAPVSAPSADPADAAHSTAAPAYHSAFDGYRPSSDMAQSVRPSGDAWRAANDAVKNADMHAGHMQMQMPSPGAGSSGDAHAGHADHQAGHQTNHQVDHQTDHDMHHHHHGGGK